MKITDSELYYHFLSRFDTRTFLKREMIIWLGSLLEETEDYPYNGYDMSNVIDAWAIDENKKLIDPTSEVKLVTETIFENIFNRIRGLSCRCEYKENPVFKTGNFINFNGNKIEIYQTETAAGKMVDIVPAEFRRSIRFEKPYWTVGQLIDIVTKDTPNRETMHQEIGRKVESTVKKYERRNKQKNNALQNGVTGGFHATVIDMFTDVFALETSVMKDATKMIIKLDNSQTVTSLESIKKKILTVDKEQKSKDNRIRQLEEKLKMEKQKRISMKKKKKKKKKK